MTTTRTPGALAPCPFCGSEVRALVHDFNTAYVECANCLARGGSHSVGPHAVKKWNRRTPSPGAGDDETYPCADCGKPRTKAEGGTVFTVCDACWERHYGKPRGAGDGAGMGTREPLELAEQLYEEMVRDHSGLLRVRRLTDAIIARDAAWTASLEADRAAHTAELERVRAETAASWAGAVNETLAFFEKVQGDLSGLVAAFDAYWHQVNGAGPPSLAVYNQMVDATGKAKAGLAGADAFLARIRSLATHPPVQPKEGR